MTNPVRREIVVEVAEVEPDNIRVEMVFVRKIEIRELFRHNQFRLFSNLWHFQLKCE